MPRGGSDLETVIIILVLDLFIVLEVSFKHPNEMADEQLDIKIWITVLESKLFPLLIQTLPIKS